jgi:hypothetical protein
LPFMNFKFLKSPRSALMLLLALFMLNTGHIYGGMGHEIANSFTHADFRPVYLSDSWVPIDPFREKVSIDPIRLPAEEIHPSLYFTAPQIPSLKAKIDRPPVDQWYDKIHQRARQAYGIDFGDRAMPEMERALYAGASAFDYVITEENGHLQNAARALLNISDPPHIVDLEGGRPGDGFGDWVYASQVMMVYLHAYDMIQPHLSEADDRVIRNKLAAELDQLCAYLPIATPNNHKTAMAAAVGLGALTLSDMPRYGNHSPQQWFDTALENLEVGLSEIAPDGSYAEGPFYAEFVAQQAFPFFTALRNKTGYDIFEYRLIQRFCDFLDAVKNPGGEISIWDDAASAPMVYHPFIPGYLKRSSFYRHDFNTYAYRDLKDYNLAAAIASYDEEIRPVDSDRRAHFFPDGGMAVFNSDKNNRLFAMLFGEPSNRFSTGHEHIDPGNINISAFGEDFILPAGYGPRGTDSRDRAYYLLPESNNIITIDGRGPDRNPLSPDLSSVRLLNCFTTEHSAASEVRASYRSAEISRKMIMIDGEFLMLIDDVQAADSVDIDLLFQTDAELINPISNGIRLSKSKGNLDIIQLNPDPGRIGIELGVGTRTGSTQEVRRIVTLNFRGEDILIPTLIVPESSDNPVDLIEEALNQPSSRGYLLNGNTCMLSNESGARISYRDITADAVFALYNHSIIENHFLFQSCTYFNYDGALIIESDIPVGAYLETSSTGMVGYIWGPESEYRISLFYNGVDPGPVYFNGIGIPYEFEDSVAKITLNGSGTIKTGMTTNTIFTIEPYRRPAPQLETFSAPWNRYRYPCYMRPAVRDGFENEMADTMVSTISWIINRHWLNESPYNTGQLVNWGTSFIGQFDRANIGVAQETTSDFELNDIPTTVNEEGVISGDGIYLRRFDLEMAPGGDRLRIRRQELIRGSYSLQSEYLLESGIDLQAGAASLYGNKQYNSGIAYRHDAIRSRLDLLWDENSTSYYTSAGFKRLYAELSGFDSDESDGFFSMNAGYSGLKVSPYFNYRGFNQGKIITLGSRFHPQRGGNYGTSATGNLNGNQLDIERIQVDYNYIRDAIGINGINRWCNNNDSLSGQLLLSLRDNLRYYRGGLEYSSYSENGSDRINKIPFTFLEMTSGLSSGSLTIRLYRERRESIFSDSHEWCFLSRYSRGMKNGLKLLGGFGGNLTEEELNSVSGGIYSSKPIFAGADFNLKLQGDQDVFTMNYTLTLPTSLGDFELGSINVYYGDWPDVSLQQSQVKLNHRGANSSPGILYRYDRTYGEYLEGYIKFRF